MKSIMTISLCLSCANLAAAQPYYGPGTPLYEKDGTYRGNIHASPYHPDSISNPYGRYGSKHSPDSLNNPYGAGSPYRTQTR